MGDEDRDYEELSNKMSHIQPYQFEPENDLCESIYQSNESGSELEEEEDEDIITCSEKHLEQEIFLGVYVRNVI